MGGGDSNLRVLFYIIPLHECTYNLSKWPHASVKTFFALHRFAVVKLGYEQAWRPFFALYSFVMTKLKRKSGHCFCFPPTL